MQKNELSMINIIFQSLNIKSPIKSQRKKYSLSKKDVKFPPSPPSAELCQNIVSDFYADTSPGYVKKLVVLFVGN
jgi:hypothetical protein